LALIASAHAADRSADPGMIDGAPAYVRFAPIFTPIIEGDQVTRQIGVTLMLQLDPGQEKDGIEAKHLQLNDAFVRDLYAFFQQRARVQTIDEAYLKGRLLQTASAVIGPNVVKEVLIEQLFEQPQ
jgi:hypothetical protein